MGMAAIVLGYLLGSIPFGLLIGKLWGRIDVRDYGSGNIGFSNVLRTVGTWPSLFVLLLDAGKGAVAVILARHLLGLDAFWVLIAGMAAIAGHNWPLYLKFKGGKGVATTAGVIISIAPLVAFIVMTIWLISLAVSRYISLSSLIAAVSLPILFFVFGFPSIYLGLAVLLSLFVIVRHVPNIQRLLAGTEFKFGQKIDKR